MNCSPRWKHIWRKAGQAGIIVVQVKNTFDILILIGRPGSGKSETSRFLTHLTESDLRQRYHLARLDILDDFPMLWVWFEEDNLLSKKFNLPRLHSDEAGYFKYRELWHLLIERLSLEYRKKVRDNAISGGQFFFGGQFSRGSEHGGYAQAFQHLSDDVLGRAAILYVRVPYEESLRKNRQRFNPDRPDSILEHGLDDKKMERLYREDDFAAIAKGDSGLIDIRGHQVPFAVFPNEDDVTTDKPEQLAARLETVLEKLWNIYRSR